jgi:hypothetical protein
LEVVPALVVPEEQRPVVAAAHHHVVRGVAALGACESKGLKPVFHFIGSKVENQALSSAMGKLAGLTHNTHDP